MIVPPPPPNFDWAISSNGRGEGGGGICLWSISFTWRLTALNDPSHRESCSSVLFVPAKTCCPPIAAPWMALAGQLWPSGLLVRIPHGGLTIASCREYTSVGAHCLIVCPLIRVRQGTATGTAAASAVHGVKNGMRCVECEFAPAVHVTQQTHWRASAKSGSQAHPTARNS